MGETRAPATGRKPRCACLCAIVLASEDRQGQFFVGLFPSLLPLCILRDLIRESEEELATGERESSCGNKTRCEPDAWVAATSCRGRVSAFFPWPLPLDRDTPASRGVGVVTCDKDTKTGLEGEAGVT